jgi:hypothetical protein
LMILASPLLFGCGGNRWMMRSLLLSVGSVAYCVAPTIRIPCYLVVAVQDCAKLSLCVCYVWFYFFYCLPMPLFWSCESNNLPLWKGLLRSFDLSCQLPSYNRTEKLPISTCVSSSYPCANLFLRFYLVFGPVGSVACCDDVGVAHGFSLHD